MKYLRGFFFCCSSLIIIGESFSNEASEGDKQRIGDLISEMVIYSTGSWPPHPQWFKAYAELKEYPGDISPELVEILTSDSSSDQDKFYTVEILRARDEVGFREIEVLEKISDSVFYSIPEKKIEEKNRSIRMIQKIFSAMTSSSDFLSISEGFFMKYAESQNRVLVFESFRILSIYGSDKSINIMKEAHSMIVDQNLKKGLSDRFSVLLDESEGISKTAPIVEPEESSSPEVIKIVEESTPEASFLPVWPWIVGALILSTALGFVFTRKRNRS